MYAEGNSSAHNPGAVASRSYAAYIPNCGTYAPPALAVTDSAFLPVGLLGRQEPTLRKITERGYPLV
jgi:hypothetical protein